MMTTPKAQIISLLNTQTHHFNGRPINGINARQLHQALGVGRMYAHWIKARIKQGQFIILSLLKMPTSKMMKI